MGNKLVDPTFESNNKSKMKLINDLLTELAALTKQIQKSINDHVSCTVLSNTNVENSLKTSEERRFNDKLK